jgi:hypothetical protein
MRLIDDGRFEVRCRCGANGVYSVAKAFAEHSVACRTCRYRTPLDPEDIQALDDHIDRIVEDVRRRKGENG